MKALKWIALLFSMLIFLSGCQSATSSEEVVADSASEQTLDPALDFTLPDSSGNMVHLADELQDNEYVVLVFYREHTCGMCIRQLVQLAENLDKYEEKGTQVIALAFQDESQAAKSVEKSGARFPVLADVDHTATSAYNVHKRFSDELAAPAIFIIAADGEIVWEYIGKNQSDRKSSAEILEQLP